MAARLAWKGAREPADSAANSVVERIRSQRSESRGQQRDANGRQDPGRHRDITIPPVGAGHGLEQVLPGKRFPSFAMSRGPDFKGDQASSSARSSSPRGWPMITSPGSPCEHKPGPDRALLVVGESARRASGEMRREVVGAAEGLQGGGRPARSRSRRPFGQRAGGPTGGLGRAAASPRPTPTATPWGTTPKPLRS